MDPLYRSLDGTRATGYDLTTHEFNFQGDVWDLKVATFSPEFNFKKYFDNSWETKNEATATNSGLYVRTPGRYSCTGEAVFPGMSHQRILNGLRMEVVPHKNKLEDFEVQVNKSKICFDKNNPDFDDLFRVIKSIARSHHKMITNHRGKKVAENHQKALANAVKQMNKYITHSGKMKPLTAQKGVKSLIETRKNNGRNQNGVGVKPVGSGKTRTGNTPTPTNPKIQNGLNMTFESCGDGPMFEWFDRGRGVLHITLNTDSTWVSDVLMNVTEEGMLAALWKVYSQVHSGVKTALNMADEFGNIDEQTFVDYMTEAIIHETKLTNKLLSK